MAGFRKRPADGEAGYFTAITPNGDAHDPTQGPPSGSIGPIYDSPRDPYSGRDKGRWGQIDRGSRDNTGAHHDY